MLYFQTLTQNEMTGYGGAAANLITQFHKLDVPMVFTELLKYYQFNTDADNDWIKKQPGMNPSIQIFFGQPYEDYEPHFYERPTFYGKSRSLKMAPVWGCFTMFESENLPPGWVDNINDKYKFDFLMTPSKWCRDIFIKAGVKCPVHYVPLGIDTAKFPYQARTKKERFVFLHRAFYLGDRKGSEILSAAFRDLKEAGALGDSLLIVKTIPFVQKYKGDVAMYDPAGIFWCQRKMSHGEMLDMMAYADVAMHPTAGEGIGIMPMEDMASGLACAISNSTGCTEYVDQEALVNFPINCFAQANWFGKIGGIEMRPDPAHVKELMLDIYNRKYDLAEMGRLASDYIHREWTVERAADEFMKVVNQYVKL
jgi:glycosyltransferase involved in cell wall biosynthesis